MTRRPEFSSAWSFSRVWSRKYPLPAYPAMSAALRRGRAVHAYTAYLDEGATLQPPAEFNGYCEAYRHGFCMAMSPSWLHVEQPFDNGKWHGVIDRIGYLKGCGDQLVIADIKTGRGRGKAAQLRVATQLACYAEGWKPSAYKNILRVGIYLHDDATWRTVVYNSPHDFVRWHKLLQEAIHGETEETPETTIEQTGEADDQRHAGNQHPQNISRSLSNPAQPPDPAKDHN